jgi:hypothetical protein
MARKSDSLTPRGPHMVRFSISCLNRQSAISRLGKWIPIVTLLATTNPPRGRYSSRPEAGGRAHWPSNRIGVYYLAPTATGCEDISRASFDAS